MNRKRHDCALLTDPKIVHAHHSMERRPMPPYLQRFCLYVTRNHIIRSSLFSCRSNEGTLFHFAQKKATSGCGTKVKGAADGKTSNPCG